MRIRTGWFALIGCLVATAVAADVVELKNGDRISGDIVDIKGGSLTMTTPYLPKGGVINIDFSQVTAIQSDKPQRVVLTSGEDVTGRFVRTADGVSIESPDLHGTKSVQLATIESVGVPAVKWSGALGASLNGSAGNTQTLGFAITGDATRETKQDVSRVGVRSGYAQNQLTRNGQKVEETTQQFTLARGRYDYNFTERFFGDVFLDLENDRFKDLNLRSRFGVGPGYRFIKTDTMVLQGVLGVAYVHETYRKSGVTNPQDDKDYATAVGSEEFRWTIADGQKLYQTLDVYPSLQKGSDFVLHIEAGYRQNIWGDFFMDLAAIDDYDHLPANGRKSNDFKYLLGGGYSF